jgi:hypothetical protein
MNEEKTGKGLRQVERINGNFWHRYSKMSRWLDITDLGYLIAHYLWFVISNVWRYQKDYQICNTKKDRQIQWPNEKGQMDKQWSSNNYTKTTDWATRLCYSWIATRLCYSWIATRLCYSWIATWLCYSWIATW